MLKFYREPLTNLDHYGFRVKFQITILGLAQSLTNQIPVGRQKDREREREIDRQIEREREREGEKQRDGNSERVRVSVRNR